MARLGDSLFSQLRGRWSPVGLHAAIVMPAVLGAVAGWTPTQVLAVGGAMVTVGYPWLAIIEGRQAPLILSPLSFFFANNTVGLGFAALWMAWLVSGGTLFLPFASAVVGVADVASGFAIYLVGSLSFHVGISSLRPLEDLAQGRGGRKIPRVAFLALWAVGIGFRFGVVEGMGTIASAFQWASAAALAAYALGSSAQDRRRPLFIAVFTLGSLIEFFLGMESGSKGVAMFAFLPALWLLSRTQGMRKWLIPAGTALAVLYFGVVLPSITASREMSVGERVSALQLLGSSGIQQLSQSREEGTAWEGLLSRMFESVAVGYLVEEVRLRGHREAPLQTVQVALIPRVLWADKPPTMQGGWFYEVVVGVGGQTALGLTAPGELYWGFGIAGVVLGMALFGFGVGLLWRFAGTEPDRHPIRMWIYVWVTMSIGNFSSEASGPFVGLVGNLLFFGALLALSRPIRSMHVEIASGSRT